MTPQLRRFERHMARAMEILDPEVPTGERLRDWSVLGSVLTLCPHARGEWARIHPFGNGNGRIARLWANWCALRYGLPPFVRLRPRQEGTRYARAAADSMSGDHRATVSLFSDWLRERMGRQGDPRESWGSATRAVGTWRATRTACWRTP